MCGVWRDIAQDYLHVSMKPKSSSMLKKGILRLGAAFNKTAVKEGNKAGNATESFSVFKFLKRNPRRCVLARNAVTYLQNVMTSPEERPSA